MNLEDIKDQLREKGQEAWSKIEESSLYIKLREKYDSLSPNLQKIVLITGVFFGIYFIYSIPSSFVSTSMEHEEYFVENRQLTRELIRAGRLAQTLETPPPAPSFSSLQNQVQASFARQRILDKQRRPITQVQGIASKKLVPKGIDQLGVKLGAKSLNLKQVIEVAEDLSKLNSSQLINMAVQADSKDPHYYSVDYELAAFSIPFVPEEPTKKKKNRKKKKR